MALPVPELSGFGLRLVSGLILAAIALTAVHYGPPWFTLLVAVAVVLMAREWPELCLAGAGTRPLWRPRPPATAVAFVASVLVAFALAAVGRYAWAMIVAGAGAALVFAFARGAEGRGRVYFALGVPYIVVPVAALLFLAGGGAERGALTIYWLFALVWATDIGGYAVGKWLDGPKLAPRISPGKTWAGFVGATLAAMLVSVAFVGAAGDAATLAVAGLGTSLVAQAGDLAESVVKRYFGVKNSGSIIPGHGGLFDRLDGLLAGAAALGLVAMAVEDAGFLWR